MSDDLDSEIYLETQRVGNVMEVRAVSAADGFEISFVAPADGPKSAVERLARAKLAYARKRRAGPIDDPEEPGSASGRGGLLA